VRTVKDMVGYKEAYTGNLTLEDYPTSIVIG